MHEHNTHVHSQACCVLLSFVFNLLSFIRNNNCLARPIFTNACPYGSFWQERGISTSCQSCGLRIYCFFLLQLLWWCWFSFALFRRRQEFPEKPPGSHNFCRWAVQCVMQFAWPPAHSVLGLHSLPPSSAHLPSFLRWTASPLPAGDATLLSAPLLLATPPYSLCSFLKPQLGKLSAFSDLPSPWAFWLKLQEL